LAKNEIICSCPITNQTATESVGYQIAGPFTDGRCDPSFFDNCKSRTANKMTGSTLYVGAPTGTADLVALLLNGNIPVTNNCFPPP